MTEYEDMVKAAAVKLALSSGWTSPQPIHLTQAHEALQAASVPEMITRLAELEDSTRRVLGIMEWATEHIKSVAENRVDPKELPAPD